MTSKFVRVAGATALLLVAAVEASAQQPVPAQPQPQPGVAVQPGATGAMTTYRAKQVLGSKVFITGNTGVGTVEDIVFDDHGNLEYLIVSDGGKLVTVPWSAAKFDVAHQTATIAIAPEQYKAIPTYTVQTYPNFWAPEYRTTVYKHYNLTPGQLRRIERRIP